VIGRGHGIGDVSSLGLWAPVKPGSQGGLLLKVYRLDHHDCLGHVV
jgi:hypothetical protein